jgi:hypothetical protein
LAKLPDPVVQMIEGIQVLRDDLIPGGTKRRVIPLLLSGADEFVYASPAYGYAQIALAHTCREMGKRATVFTAKRGQLHPRTLEAKAAGAKIVMVPYGYLSHVQAKARSYCEATGAKLLPFGLDVPAIRDGIAEIARGLSLTPAQVFSVAGSGTLARALQDAWPQSEFVAVQVGSQPNVGRARLLVAPEKFEDDAMIKPPFPSCLNYDAKAWRFIVRHAQPGALFWNVAA